MKRITYFLILCLALPAITGCKHFWKHDDDEDDSPYKGMTSQQLYTEAKQKMKKHQYTEAITRLEALDTLYPFNDKAEQAGIELIYAYYKKEDYPSCAATAERFIHLYPRSSAIDYAYYMKGLSNFNQTRGVIADVLPMNISKRDPGTQSQAYSDFASLVQKFPDSPYQPSALQHMIFLRNSFAQRELNAAQYYYDRQMYVAAEERANYYIKTYPQAPHAKEALAIVYYSDLALHLNDAAHDALSVYQATYHRKPKKPLDHSQEL